MKHIVVASIIGLVIALPFQANAQVITLESLRQQLIQLLTEQVAILQAQLDELISAQAELNVRVESLNNNSMNEPDNEVLGSAAVPSAEVSTTVSADGDEYTALITVDGEYDTASLSVWYPEDSKYSGNKAIDAGQHPKEDWNGYKLGPTISGIYKYEVNAVLGGVTKSFTGEIAVE